MCQKFLDISFVTRRIFSKALDELPIFNSFYNIYSRKINVIMKLQKPVLRKEGHDSISFK